MSYNTRQNPSSQAASGTSGSSHQAAQALSTRQSSGTVSQSASESNSNHPATSSGPPAPCPYHSAVLLQQSQGETALGRFLAEGPGEQHALFNRADTRQTSLARPCTCLQVAAALVDGGYRHVYGYPIELAEEDLHCRTGGQ